MDNTEEQGVFARILQSNPLALGFVALTLGAIVGALIPESRQENELMGGTRDQLAHKAQETATELGKKVSVVAATAGTAAHDALDTAKGAAQDALTEALGTVKEEAKQQGLIPDAPAAP